MVRLLLLIAILAVIALLFKRLYEARDRRAQDEALKKPQKFDSMVACAHCGVHVPKSESLQDGESFYCCEAHYRSRKTGD